MIWALRGRKKKGTNRKICIHLLLLPLVHPTQYTSTQTLESSSQTDSFEHFTLLFCSAASSRSFHDETLWSRLFFASRLKQNKKSQLWTIASSSSQHSEAPQVKSSSQQTFTRGAQLIRSLKTGSFLGCFCAMIAPSSPATCTPSFCIKHLSDSSPFVFCSAVFSAFHCTPI